MGKVFAYGVVAAIVSCVIWHGLTIKVGAIFSYEIYPLSRFFK